MKRRKFFSGYGSSASNWVIEVDSEPPPQAVIEYRNKLWRLICTCCWGLALLPFALWLFFQSWRSAGKLLRLHVGEYHGNLNCAFTEYAEPFFVWCFVAAALLVFVMVWSIFNYPRSCVSSMARRIKRVRDHLWMTIAAFGASLLLCGILDDLGCASGESVRGHAQFLLKGLISGPIGNALIGPMLWIFSVLTFLVTIFLLLHLIARILFRETEH